MGDLENLLVLFPVTSLVSKMWGLAIVFPACFHTVIMALFSVTIYSFLIIEN